MMHLLPLLLQRPTPDTVSYLIVGYAIIGGIGLAYVISLIWRQRGLSKDVEVLKMLQEDED